MIIYSIVGNNIIYLTQENESRNLVMVRISLRTLIQKLNVLSTTVMRQEQELYHLRQQHIVELNNRNLTRYITKEQGMVRQHSSHCAYDSTYHSGLPHI